VQNLSDVTVPFVPRRTVHVVGRAAERVPKAGERIQGIMVQRQKGGDASVMAPEDLGVYNKVATGRILQRQVMPLQTGFTQCRLALEMMFEGIDASQAMGGVECLQADGALCIWCLRHLCVDRLAQDF
jgi:hypothetical protein